jgi:hypothetical protein
MSIARLSGQMLQPTLLRDGINLSFQNSNVSNATLFLDIANTQVGINANVPAATLDVKGNVLADIYTANISVVTANVNSTGAMSISSAASGNILIDADGYTRIVGTDAFYVPVGNTAERPGSPDIGALRFNTTNSQLEVWDGSQWDAATGDLSVISNQTITPDGSTASYTLTQTATADTILVSINGVMQTPSVDYTVSGTTITFTSTPLSSDIIQVRFIASTATVTGIQNGNSSILINTTNGNAVTTINGVANVAVFASSGVYVDTLSATANLALPVYTVAAANALSGIATGQLIYVSNGDSGNPCLAVYSSGAWKRVALGATIST